MVDDNLDKVFTPVVIAEAPFPTDETTNFDTSQTTTGTSGNQTSSSPTVSLQPFPYQQTAVELLASALNTRSRKIIAEFQFTSMGAIQIGNYQEGVTGDIRISPIGIVARNMLGDTTFALDGESGDAVFAGTIQAGTIVSGGVVVNGEGNIQVQGVNSFTVIDSFGLVSVSNFFSTSATKTAGYNQKITSSNYDDLTDATFTFTLPRTAKVLILGQVISYGARESGGSGAWSTQYKINLIINGTEDVNGEIFEEAQYRNTQEGESSGAVHVTTSNLHSIPILPAGSNTFKLACKLITNNDAHVTIYKYKFSYMILGT